MIVSIYAYKYLINSVTIYHLNDESLKAFILRLVTR